MQQLLSILREMIPVFLLIGDNKYKSLEYAYGLLFMSIFPKVDQVLF
jgi:hypothetical protein